MEHVVWPVSGYKNALVVALRLNASALRNLRVNCASKVLLTLVGRLASDSFRRSRWWGLRFREAELERLEECWPFGLPDWEPQVSRPKRKRFTRSPSGEESQQQDSKCS